MELGLTDLETMFSVKVEEDMDYNHNQFSKEEMDYNRSQTPWDSGVVLDTNTVVQMAEFQEVVDSLQRALPPPHSLERALPPPHSLEGELPAPPPYPQEQVKPAASSPDRDLENILNSAPVLFRNGVMSYQGPGFSQPLGVGAIRPPCLSLPLITEQSPNIVDRVGQKYAVSPRPPTFKQSTATSRTNMRQLLSREQCMQREQQAEQFRLQEQLAREAASHPAIDIPDQVKEIPNDVLKIETRLENPTKYHVLESQRRQVAEYLSAPTTPATLSPHPLFTTSPNPHALSCPPTRRSSVAGGPLTPTGASRRPSGGPYSPGGRPGSRRASGGGGPYSPGGGRPWSRRASGGGGPPPAAPFSPSCSSATTSPSEYTPSEVCEDFFDEILSQGEGGGEGGLLDHLVKDEPLGEDDVRAIERDRIKKDNHNMIERRRRFNINDRIKELGTLLPKQSEPYYDLVRDVRHNKGSILKASVDYIRLLKKEKEKKMILDEEVRRTKHQNRKLLLKLQEYEQRMQSAGLGLEKSTWRPATHAEISNIAESGSKTIQEQSKTITVDLVEDDVSYAHAAHKSKREVALRSPVSDHDEMEVV